MIFDMHEMYMMQRYSYKCKTIKVFNNEYCVMRYDVGTTTIYSLFDQQHGDRVLLAKSGLGAFNWVATCNYVVRVDNNSEYWKKSINFEFMKSKGGFGEQNAIIRELL